MLRDEPTVQQINNDADNLFAELAFSVILRNKNPEMARQRLAMMSNEKLDYLAHACKKLLVLAEAEQRARQAAKARQG